MTVTERYWAWWGEPRDLEPGQRLSWPDGNPVLADEPELISGGLPTQLWRVLDTGDGIEIVARVPPWRVLGIHGRFLLARLDRTVAECVAHGGHTPPAHGHTPYWPWSDIESARPAAHAIANFAEVARRRLIEAAKAVDPGAVAVYEDYLCAGPVYEAWLLGRWATAERALVAEARALEARSIVPVAYGRRDLPPPIITLPQPMTPSNGRGPGSCLALDRQLRGTSAEVSCDFVPGSGLVWVCRGHRETSGDGQRLRRQVAHVASSADVACTGAASAVLSTEPFATVASLSEEGYLACEPHRSWLYDHWLSGTMMSGTVAIRDEHGVWQDRWDAAKRSERQDPELRPSTTP